MRWGEHLQFTAEAGPGDFIFVPPYVPHQEINASRDETLECVLVRSDGEAVAINLESSRWKSRRRCCGSIPRIAIPRRRRERRLSPWPVFLPVFSPWCDRVVGRRQRAAVADADPPP